MSVYRSTTGGRAHSLPLPRVMDLARAGNRHFDDRRPWKTRKTDPADCRLFGQECTPARPVGPCMVSSEGTCAAWYKYGRSGTSIAR